MPDPAPFRAAPADDAPRLVYADWLDDHGQPERAEFIRVQCELARRDSPDLRAREAELLARHHDDFAAHLAAPGLRFKFERGLIVAFGHMGVYVHRPSEPSADRPQEVRQRLGLSLQLFPNRLVQGGMSDDPANPVGWLFRRKHLGRYDLDAVSSVAEIRFALTSERSTVEFRGQFLGSTLRLDRFRRAHNFTDQVTYVHLHLDGFNSFSDPPTDAAPTP